MDNNLHFVALFSSKLNNLFLKKNKDDNLF